MSQVRQLLVAALSAQDGVTSWRHSRWGPTFPEAMKHNREAWARLKERVESVQNPDPWLATAIQLLEKFHAGEVGALTALREHARSNP